MTEKATVIAALYRFVALPDYRELREPLLAFCLERGLRGTLLLAEEGINGTVAGTRPAVDALLSRLRSDPRLSAFEHRESTAATQPFLRMKVKLKREIVTLGVPGIDPTRRVGEYVDPRDWNALIEDPEVLLVDTRNHYEAGIGSFRGALKPGTNSFREFPDWVRSNLDRQRHRKIAMFCTGGIRCEKATSYLLEQGFEEVYHLRGGILSYLEHVPRAESLWEGECFVFDERVTVSHGLEPGTSDQCHACRHPLTAAEQASPLFERGVSCPHCHGQRSEAQQARTRERERQTALARERGTAHRGVNPRVTAARRSDP